MLSSNISSTCSHNMVNFGPLAAEIVSLVWGTPANFNGFRVFAALLHGTLVVGVSQSAALNRGRHLHSAGRPLRWALANISSFNLFFVCMCLLSTDMVNKDYQRTHRRSRMARVNKDHSVQFYLLTFSANRMNHIRLYFSSAAHHRPLAGTHFPSR